MYTFFLDKDKNQRAKNSNETGNNARPDVVECPAPDVIRLPVPASTHPKSQLENHLRGRGDKKSVPVQCCMVTEIIERPRSFSDVDSFQRCRSAASDNADVSSDGYPRPLSWSPTQFPVNYRTPSRASSSIKSDRFSDSSSIYLSDTWSESSDSDSIQSPTHDKSSRSETNNQRISFSNEDSPPRKYKGNPLANVTYWVVNSGDSVEVHKSYADNDQAAQHRPQVKVNHQGDGLTPNGHLHSKASLVAVHDETADTT